MTEILSYIQRLLSEPDLSSVVNHEAARLYREDRREYARRVDRVIDSSLDIEKTLGNNNFSFLSIDTKTKLEGSRDVREGEEGRTAGEGHHSD